MKAVSLNREVKQPATIKPMLATLVQEPFNDDDYLYEVKWDGYRIIAFCHQSEVKLQSRGGEDYTRKYPAVVKALKALDVDCIIDGEMVYINKEGKPDFDALQRVNGQNAPIVYYAFDLLCKDGVNLMGDDLIDRKQKLRELIPGGTFIKFSEHFDDGILLFEHVRNMGMEGIVAKRRNSAYLPGDRSKRWLKVATAKRHEFVIGGWIESEKRNTFRTLLFGSYENGRLRWKGHAGSGYKEKDMPKILNRLKQLEVDENPFDSEVEYSEGRPHWVRPELVANIRFATFTSSGRIAIFLGFREDKKAEEVVTETARPAPKKRILTPEKKSADPIPDHHALPTSADSNWPALEAEPIRNEADFFIDDCKITLSNVDRQIWKGITKGDLIQYYNSISKYLLPHVRNRALSLHVKPRGAHAPGLYIKDMEQRQPPCAAIFTTPRKHRKAGKRDVIDYLVCNNTATLLYMVNLGCIDINPWTSTVDDPLHPNFIVVDLDPSDQAFAKAVETARAAKQFFDEHKLKAFVKTSGKTGIHLFIPASGLGFPEARRIAETICDTIHELVPDITTTTVTVSDRGNRLYLDPNQNDYSDTVASVYSARPHKHPWVSAALEWQEVTHSLHPESFTIKTIVKRLERKGDLFLPVLDKKIAQANTKILKGLYG